MKGLTTLNALRKKVVPYSLMHGGCLAAGRTAAAPGWSAVGTATQLKYQPPFICCWFTSWYHAIALRASPSADQLFEQPGKKPACEIQSLPILSYLRGKAQRDLPKNPLGTNVVNSVVVLRIYNSWTLLKFFFLSTWHRRVPQMKCNSWSELPPPHPLLQDSCVHGLLGTSISPFLQGAEKHLAHHCALSSSSNS